MQCYCLFSLWTAKLVLYAAVDAAVVLAAVVVEYRCCSLHLRHHRSWSVIPQPENIYQDRIVQSFKVSAVLILLLLGFRFIGRASRVVQCSLHIRLLTTWKFSTTLLHIRLHFVGWRDYNMEHL
mmetsp:Transcript_32768/g.53508  ORF Transcript_32768/g.53508 Transcript_32768/m.53508 type:complete len:124 (+) Transcript_32768:101-472(+)